jgi:hypothetical protein
LKTLEHEWFTHSENRPTPNLPTTWPSAPLGLSGLELLFCRWTALIRHL